MILTKKFTFDAAHHLPGHPTCGNNHGHSFILKVSIEGKPVDNMVIDYHHLKDIVNEAVIQKLDHTDLNLLFEYPSSEVVIVWIWKQLVEEINIIAEKSINPTLKLQEVKLYETIDDWVAYQGETIND